MRDWPARALAPLLLALMAAEILHQFSGLGWAAIAAYAVMGLAILARSA